MFNCDPLFVYTFSYLLIYFISQSSILFCLPRAKGNKHILRGCLIETNERKRFYGHLGLLIHHACPFYRSPC